MGILTIEGTKRFLLPPNKPLLSFLNLGFGRFHTNSGSQYDYPEKFDYLDDALYLFGELLQSDPLPSTFYFTRLFDVVTKIKHYSFSIYCFKHMCAAGVPVNRHTASLVINCYTQLQHAKHSFTVLGYCFKHGIVPHARTYDTLIKNNALVKGFIAEDKAQEAEKRLNNLSKSLDSKPNLFAINNMIAGLCKNLQAHPLPSSCYFSGFLKVMTKRKHYSSSIDCFKQMCAAGVSVNKQTCCIILNCYSQLHQTKHGFTVLGYCLKHGMVPDVSTCNTLIHGYITEDKTHEADRLFKKLIKTHVCTPNLVTYNTMIAGLCKIGDNVTAIALVRLMDGRGCKPDVSTYNTIIGSLCNDLMVEDAFKLFKGMICHNSVPSPNIVTYNILINALCKLGRLDEVSRMVKEMEDLNISPDIKTFNAIIDALCKQGSIKEAELVIDIIYKNLDIDVDTETVNSLIKGYCLQGDMMKARENFNCLGCRDINRNVDSYNIMMDGYCRNSKTLGNAALFYYHELVGVKPKPKPENKVAVNIIMMASRGMQDESQVYLYYLRPEYGFDDDTYEDALDFFHFMEDNGSNLNSNIDVYNTLIEGALKRGKFDTARRLFHDLFVVKGLEPDDDTYKMMISGFGEIGLHKYVKKLVIEQERLFAEHERHMNIVRHAWTRKVRYFHPRMLLP